MEVGKLLPRHDETVSGREFEEEPSCAVLQPETLHSLLHEPHFSRAGSRSSDPKPDHRELESKDMLLLPGFGWLQGNRFLPSLLQIRSRQIES